MLSKPNSSCYSIVLFLNLNLKSHCLKAQELFITETSSDKGSRFVALVNNYSRPSIKWAFEDLLWQMEHKKYWVVMIRKTKKVKK